MAWRVLTCATHAEARREGLHAARQLWGACITSSHHSAAPPPHSPFPAPALQYQGGALPALLNSPSWQHLLSPPCASPPPASALSQPGWRQLGMALPQMISRSFAVSALQTEGGLATGAVDPPRMKTKALSKQAKHIMNILDAERVQTLKQERTIPDFWPGDVLALKVEVPENKRRVSLLRGIVIARRNAGIGSTFRIRRVMAGVGVELVFPLYSPNIKEIKIIDKRKARRAKLYYLRDKIARLSTVN